MEEGCGLVRRSAWNRVVGEPRKDARDSLVCSAFHVRRMSSGRRVVDWLLVDGVSPGRRGFSLLSLPTRLRLRVPPPPVRQAS